MGKEDGNESWTGGSTTKKGWKDEIGVFTVGGSVQYGPIETKCLRVSGHCGSQKPERSEKRSATK